MLEVVNPHAADILRAQRCNTYSHAMMHSGEATAEQVIIMFCIIVAVCILQSSDYHVCAVVQSHHLHPQPCCNAAVLTAGALVSSDVFAGSVLYQMTLSNTLSNDCINDCKPYQPDHPTNTMSDTLDLSTAADGSRG